MPLQDGDYIPRTEDEIYDTIVSEMKERFGDDIDLTPNSVFDTLARSMATVLSSNQEQSLSNIYDAAYLETASGEDLDKVVDIVGISRRSATNTTGVVEFSRTSIPTTTRGYSVPSDTIVQTEGDNPIKFSVTQTPQAKIQLFDDFDNLSSYQGDTGSFSVSGTRAHNTNTFNGQSLSSNSTGVIYRGDRRVRQGHTYSTRVYLNSGGVSEQYILLEDTDNGVRTVYDDTNGEHRIEIVSGSNVVDNVSEATTIPTSQWSENEIKITIDNRIISRIYDSNENLVSELELDEGVNPTYDSGFYGFGNSGGNQVYWDVPATKSVVVNISAVEGGSNANVGANTLTVSPNPPSGFDSWTNPYPTGNDRYRDVTNDVFVVGQDEESDAELRERTRLTLTSGGTATVDALLSAVINDVDNVQSVTLLENDTDSSAVPPNGTVSIPPYSFEMVVQGGNSNEIAQTIFDNKGVTSRDVNGYHGVVPSGANKNDNILVTSEANGDDYGIKFSRPNPVFLDIELNLLVTDEYVGDTEIANKVVNYVGGFDSNNVEVLGLDVQEDVYVDTIEDIIVGDNVGVRGIPIDDTNNYPSTSQIDITGYYEDSNGNTQTVTITQDSDGLEHVAIGTGNVATADVNGINVDLSDVSVSNTDITVNSTEV